VEFFFVQMQHLLDSHERTGWKTVGAFMDREAAERRAAELERAGEDVSGHRLVTETRVVSAEELLEEGGPEALRAARLATQEQLDRLLEERPEREA
jgi:hypothetical protein